MTPRPTNASLALAVVALGSGMLTILLNRLGMALPVAVLAAVVAGASVYMVLLLLVRRRGGPRS